MQGGPIHLADAAGGDWFALEVAKGLIHLLAQRFAHQRLDLLPGLDGHIGLQAAEGIDVVLGQQIRAGAQQLAELHVDRAQLDQDLAEHLRLGQARFGRIAAVEEL